MSLFSFNFINDKKPINSDLAGSNKLAPRQYLLSAEAQDGERNLVTM
jgi:hypothetical protein